MNDRLTAAQPQIALALRGALSFAFLSAVADRLGYWGETGAPGVAWGNFDVFLEYTATLNPFVPASLIPALGLVATATEIILAIALLLGIWTRWAALASGVLLILFATGMCIATGIKAPLDYSVLSAAAAAILLSTVQDNGWGVDQWRHRRTHHPAT